MLIAADGSPVFPLELDAVLAKHLAPGAPSALLQPEPGRFTLMLGGEASASLRDRLQELLGGTAATVTLEVAPYAPPRPGEKLRRFRRLFDPASDVLTRALLPPRRPGAV